MSQSNALAVVQQGQATQVVALDDWTETRTRFVIDNYCGGAPEATAMAFIQVARKRRLSPEEKQIYLINRGGKWGVETSIDGYRLIADRSDAYAGSDEPVFGPTVEGHPESASVTVYKIVQGQRVPFTAVAWWDEFAPEGNQAFMWTRMPRHMLAKVAEAHALRKAFPADLSGIYVSEEMHQAEDATRTATVRDVTPRGSAAKPKAVPANVPRSDPGGPAKAQQVKALRDICARKGMNDYDLVLLFGGEAWADAITEASAGEWLTWMQGAKRDQIDAELAKAAAKAAATDRQDIDAETGEIIDAEAAS